ncbi:MAG: hypothetical protein EBW54_06235 [Betaproteobacteria bacterium]|nr:hypothetical protein [Betaproteobacteria bacterium]
MSTTASNKTHDIAHWDTITGGAFTAVTSGERAQRVKDWLASDPAQDAVAEVYRELSTRDKGAAKLLRERLDDAKRAKAQEAIAAEWEAKARALLELSKLNIADALAWQRDAAKAGAPLSREPLAGIKLQLAERVRVIEDLQHQAQVQREAAVLLANLKDFNDGEEIANPLESLAEMAKELHAKEIAKREIDKQRAANYPNVDAVVSSSASKGSSPFQPSSKIQNNSIGLQVSVPLYTGGAIASRIVEANALFDKARQDAETARRAAEQGVRSAFLSVNSLMAQANALEEAEKSSALALESNELGYQVGVRINIDVLNALQQLSSTRRDLSKARYDALLAGLRLKSAAGGLTSDDLRSIRAMLATERPINIPPDVAGTSFDTPVKVGQPLKPR